MDNLLSCEFYRHLAWYCVGGYEYIAKTMERGLFRDG